MCRICLFSQVIISSILLILSVFSQLPTLPLLGQNLLSSNQSSTCFFFCVLFWLPVAFSDLVSHREREETPWYSQNNHCLCLLRRGKKRNTPPLMPSTVALPLLAPTPPPTATSAQLQEPQRGRPQSVSLPGHWRQESSFGCFSSIPIKSLYLFFKLERRRKATHRAVSSGRENPYYMKFRRWAKEGDMAPRLQYSNWQRCPTGKDTFKTFFNFFFFSESEQVCMYSDTHTRLISKWQLLFTQSLAFKMSANIPL